MTAWFTSQQLLDSGRYSREAGEEEVQNRSLGRRAQLKGLSSSLVEGSHCIAMVSKQVDECVELERSM